MAAAARLARLLEERLPRGRVYRDPAVASLYALEASGLRGEAPAAVVFPESTGEVSLVLREAYAHGVPVFLHGSGSSLSGSAVPLGEGIVVSMERMNRLREVALRDGYVEAEAGVRLGELDAFLAGNT